MPARGNSANRIELWQPRASRSAAIEMCCAMEWDHLVTRPIIATTLYVPKARRDLVSRPRLHERLRIGAEARLVLVSAPAGFGKSTLLAEWFGETSEGALRVAWVSLGPGTGGTMYGDAHGTTRDVYDDRRAAASTESARSSCPVRVG